MVVEYWHTEAERAKLLPAKKEEQTMKGYYTANGYYGLVGSEYVLFSDETDYYEYMDEEAA